MCAQCPCPCPAPPAPRFAAFPEQAARLSPPRPARHCLQRGRRRPRAGTHLVVLHAPLAHARMRRACAQTRFERRAVHKVCPRLVPAAEQNRAGPRSHRPGSMRARPRRWECNALEAVALAASHAPASVRDTAVAAPTNQPRIKPSATATSYNTLHASVTRRTQVQMHDLPLERPHGMPQLRSPPWPYSNPHTPVCACVRACVRVSEKAVRRVDYSLMNEGGAQGRL